MYFTTKIYSLDNVPDTIQSQTRPKTGEQHLVVVTEDDPPGFWSWDQHPIPCSHV